MALCAPKGSTVTTSAAMAIKVPAKRRQSTAGLTDEQRLARRRVQNAKAAATHRINKQKGESAAQASKRKQEHAKVSRQSRKKKKDGAAAAAVVVVAAAAAAGQGVDDSTV